jgi:hypothetical protein
MTVEGPSLLVLGVPTRAVLCLFMLYAIQPLSVLPYLVKNEPKTTLQGKMVLPTKLKKLCPTANLTTNDLRASLLSSPLLSAALFDHGPTRQMSP